MKKLNLKKLTAVLLSVSLLATTLSGCFLQDAFNAVWKNQWKDALVTKPAVTTPQKIEAENPYENTEEHKGPGEEPYSGEEFKEFTDRIFAYYLEDSTLDMHYFIYDAESYGMDPYTPKFSPITAGPEAEEEYISDMQGYLNELHSFDYDTLGWEEQFEYDCLEDFFETEIKGAGFSYFAEPLSASNGVQSVLPIELAEYNFYTVKDVDTYLGLLNLVPDYFKDILRFENEKKDAGFFMEDDILEEVIDQCQEFIDGRSDDNFLFVTFEDRLDALNLSDSEKKEYMKKNEEAVDSLYAGYELLVKELPAFYGSNQYKGGLCNYPNGAEYYAYLVRSNVGTDKSPKEIEALLDARITEGMQNLRSMISANPYLYDQMDAFVYPSKDPNLIMRMLIDKSSKDFPALSEVDYNISYVDKSLREYLSPAFYFVTPFDKDTMNNIYINCERGEEDDDIFITLAHEGYPGHLYQSNFVKQNSNLALRSLIATNGFTEGYAEYVEHLSYNYLDDISPELAEFMRLNDQLILYIYARVDLGIHIDGWDKDGIGSFISDYFGDDEETVTWMYNHILGDPAGYLDYMVGELEILELKEEAKAAENYSEMDFHTSLLILSGAPFYIIKRWMLY